MTGTAMVEPHAPLQIIVIDIWRHAVADKPKGKLRSFKLNCQLRANECITNPSQMLQPFLETWQFNEHWISVWQSLPAPLGRTLLNVMKLVCYFWRHHHSCRVLLRTKFNVFKIVRGCWLFVTYFQALHDITGYYWLHINLCST